MEIKTKKQIIKYFGSYDMAASAMGVTMRTMYNWPDQLKTSQINTATGAAYRLGLLPKDAA